MEDALYIVILVVIVLISWKSKYGLKREWTLKHQEEHNRAKEAML